MAQNSTLEVRKIWKEKEMLWMLLLEIIDQKLSTKINWKGATIDFVQ